ncbi:hypothetical protein DFH09DRAFT_1099116 [Mycena vulgaris]|nr:hypothetical protein DFH09DRAFT_1099116 [Mycena vulgaris]
MSWSVLGSIKRRKSGGGKQGEGDGGRNVEGKVARNSRRTRGVARGGVVRYLKGSAAHRGIRFKEAGREMWVWGIASGTKRQFRLSAANRPLTALGSEIPDKTEAPIKVPGTFVALPPARLPHLRAPPKFEFAPFWGVRITRGLDSPDQILRDFTSAVGVNDGAGGGEREPDMQKGMARDGLRKSVRCSSAASQ